MPMTKVEAYEILGVPPTSTEAEVKSAYRRLALKTHPDKNPNDPNANKRFLQISEAYKRITDPESFKDEDGEGLPTEEEMMEMFMSMFQEFAPMMGGMGMDDPGMMMGMMDMMMGGLGDSDDGSDDDFMMGGGMGMEGMGGEMGIPPEVMMMMMMGDDDDYMMTGRDPRGKASARSKKGKNKGKGKNSHIPDEDEELRMLMEMMGGGGMGGMESAGIMGMPGMGGLMGFGGMPRGPSSKGKKKTQKPVRKGKHIPSDSDSSEDWESTDTEDGTTLPPTRPTGTKKNTKASLHKPTSEQDFINMLNSEMYATQSSSEAKGKQKKPKKKAAEGLGLGSKMPPAAASAPSSRSIVASSSDEDDGLPPLLKRITKTTKASASAAPSSTPASATSSSTSKYNVDDKVLVQGKYQGVVKFVGQVEYTSGIYIGVMITDQSGVGKNNGTIKGKQYFSCPHGRGLMIRYEDTTLKKVP